VSILPLIALVIHVNLGVLSVCCELVTLSQLLHQFGAVGLIVLGSIHLLVELTKCIHFWIASE
jgi:hypothetical protein